MVRYASRPTRLDRARALVAVVLIHAVALSFLMLKRSHPVPPEPLAPEAVQTIEIPIEPVPPPTPLLPDRPKDEDGAAGKKADPSPIVSPAKTRQPQPVVAAPVAGSGTSSDAGAATAGDGPGAGRQGSGRGGGGNGGSAAQWLSGGLTDADYPDDALRARASGKVSIRFTVLATGRIANCRVVGSSGNGSLDATTCALLSQRLRFRPATDASGRPVETELGSDIGWGLRNWRR